MSFQRVFLAIVTLVALATPLALANTQVSEQAAREVALNAVRSELQSTVNFKSNKFLAVQRDEELEQSLAVAVVRPPGSEFIYRVSPAGYEIKGGMAVYNSWSDFNPEFLVAVSDADGTLYRIRGFGVAESLAEFERLIVALTVRVSSSEQAEAIAEFYREVNPENREGLTPILRLIELKQAAERQCLGNAKSFDAGERAFAAWWDHAKPLYSEFSFQQRAVPHGSGYLVDWNILSSPSAENCGGSPLRATLEVGENGEIGKLTFIPLQSK
jgi:hypothetical protein